MLRRESEPARCREGQREQGGKLHALLASKCLPMPRQAAFPVGVLRFDGSCCFSRGKPLFLVNRQSQGSAGGSVFPAFCCCG
jgi:hypothetical protein